MKSKYESKYFFTLIVLLSMFLLSISPASVWLKLCVDPAFFRLHITGGALFGAIITANAILMLRQMRGDPS
jgi:hypothetical protein